MNVKYLVSFKSYDKYLEDNLKDKTIWFSRAPNLNDFYELNYIHPPRYEPLEGSDIFDDHMGNDSFRKYLTENLPKQMYAKKEVENLILRLNRKEQLDDYQISLIYEWIAFFNVGICCLSDIKVFSDDAATLMFAHYTNSLKGVALIYEVLVGTVFDVIYLPSSTPHNAGGDVLRFDSWCKGDYKEMEDFLRKSDKWGYEAERRLFSKPGKRGVEDSGLELKAVLYTPRLQRADEDFLKGKDFLDEVNRVVYKGELKVKEILPSWTSRKFVSSDDESPITARWIEELVSK